MAPKVFVALAGNIGTGKSTAASLISRHLGFEIFHEPVLDNRFLKSYYRDMTRWSFTLQMEFLLKRIEHHMLIERHQGSCVQDRTLIEDPEVFAKYLHGLGHMSDEELDLYFDYFKRFNTQVAQPDRVILLHTPDVNVLLRRIAERGREEERGITADFLSGLNGYYSSFASVLRRKYQTNVLTIDVTRLDIRQNPGKGQFLDEVRAFIAGEPTGNNQLALQTTTPS